jgi:hypothetical protein
MNSSERSRYMPGPVWAIVMAAIHVSKISVFGEMKLRGRAWIGIVPTLLTALILTGIGIWTFRRKGLADL